jgi:hypothetical protein
VAAGANEAKGRCFRLVHEDAYEFLECVDALVKDAEAHRPLQAARRLGLLYFGWVGAVACDRLSMGGAAEASRRYRPLFRAEQRRLQVSDEVLCATVEGDCLERLVRLRADEAEAAPSSADAGAARPRAR